MASEAEELLTSQDEEVSEFAPGGGNQDQGLSLAARCWTAADLGYGSEIGLRRSCCGSAGTRPALPGSE